MKNIIKQLRDDVEQLALPEGRMVGTAGHEKARQFVIRRMTEMGLSFYGKDKSDYAFPYRQYDQDFCNLVGCIKGEDSSLPPVLIGAHYDSVIEAPCADDNASAVAITFMMAEALKDQKLSRDVIIAIFDAEEPPYYESAAMGSIRFVEDQLDEREVQVAIISDLVGHDVVFPKDMLEGAGILASIAGLIPGLRGDEIALPNIKDMLFFTGIESHPDFMDVVDSVTPSSSIRPVATLNEYVGDMSDHGAFRREGFPFLFFSCGQWPHYHEPTDTPDRLNYKKMYYIGQYMLGITQAILSKGLCEQSKKFDTTEFEVRYMEKAFGMMLPLVKRFVGMKDIRTRKDLKQFVAGFMDMGL